MSRGELETKMAVLLGGRAAEQLVFGQFSTGAADDLAKATDIARAMVTRYGMDPDLGHVRYEEEAARFLGGLSALGGGTRRDYSEHTADRIDRAVRRLVDEAFARALATLGERRAVLERGAGLLLDRETLGEGELADLARQAPGPAPGA